MDGEAYCSASQCIFEDDSLIEKNEISSNLQVVWEALYFLLNHPLNAFRRGTLVQLNSGPKSGIVKNGDGRLRIDNTVGSSLARKNHIGYPYL